MGRFLEAFYETEERCADSAGTLAAVASVERGLYFEPGAEGFAGHDEKSLSELARELYLETQACWLERMQEFRAEAASGLPERERPQNHTPEERWLAGEYERRLSDAIEDLEARGDGPADLASAWVWPDGDLKFDIEPGAVDDPSISDEAIAADLGAAASIARRTMNDAVRDAQTAVRKAMAEVAKEMGVP